MKNSLLAGLFILFSFWDLAVPAGQWPLKDKTLVVWVAPANLNQRGGSALTIDDNESHFDGIVFGEINAGKWMAGSDGFIRTAKKQDACQMETAGAGTFVQIAVVYRGKEVTVYRNGKEYSHYQVNEPQEFMKGSTVLMGLRHLDAHDKACFTGSIDDARIYNVPLSVDQISALKVNEPSDPVPVAWWNFQDGMAEDKMGTFPPATFTGKARIENGMLMLDGDGSSIIILPKSVPPAPLAGEMVLNYHLMHPGGESLPGDPNAAFCLDGVYHLHYILAHDWQGKRSFSFVHVTSPDMLHWSWQTTKLQPSFTGHGMFSGTGFMTKEGRPAAIYHGQGSGKNQIAIAKDKRLSAWEKPYPVDVRNADGTELKMGHWDPDCWLIGDTYYAISGGQNPPLLKSKDLKTWTRAGDFLRNDLPDVAIGEDISCANFFRIGNKWMLLCISHPLGCRYYIGDWDSRAEQFIPVKHGRMNWRRENQSIFGTASWRVDFFAPESVLTPDGRRVMWAWLATLNQDDGKMNRLTVQSLPRELSLPDDGVLRMKPLRELESLRFDPVSLSDVKVNVTKNQVPAVGCPAGQKIADFGGEAVEIRINIPREEAVRKLFGFTLFPDGKGGGLPIMFRPENGTLRVGTAEAPFSVAGLPAGEDIEMRIFVDRYLVEVFVNDRQAMVAFGLDYREKTDLNAFTVGSPTTIRKIEIWKLKPANQGFLEARKSHIWEPVAE